MSKTPLTLEEIQALCLDILRFVDRICKAEHIQYFMSGGTLLGAVRHGGFIPWDDDVDVFMPRPDYDRMVEICRTEPVGDRLELANYRSGGLMRAFSKLYDTKSSVERRNHKEEAGKHIWIDILPVDGLPDDPEAIAKLLKLRSYIGKINMNAMWKFGVGQNKRLVMKRMLYYPLAKVVGAKRWAALLDWMARRHPYEKCDTVGCFIAGRYGKGEAMPRAKFEIPDEIAFEGHMFGVMSCYKEYLSGIYGDYMTPPPANRRYTHVRGMYMEPDAYRALREKYPELNNQ